MQFSFKFRVLVLSFVVFSLCFAQNKEVPVLKIGDDVVTLREFEKEYIRSSGKSNVKENNIDELKKFLDLYTGFRLKLNDAKEKGYNEDESLLREFEEYKKTVSESYYTTKFIKSPGLKEFYNKSLKEFRASHLLVKIDTNRNQEDAFNLAKLIIDSLKNGADWSEMVKKHSEDEKTIPIDGDLYYYSGIQLGGDFQNALFNTNVNGVHENPVKSRFGYHIVKLTEKRDRIPAIKAKHILIFHKDSTGQVNEERSKKLCEELHKRVLNGEKFDDIAKKYSDDKGSGIRGGDLGYIQRRKTVQEFDEVLFNTKPGEISNVFRTQYGYHFLTVTEYKPQQSFEEFNKSVAQSYERNVYKNDYTEHLDKLGNKYDLNINDNNISLIADRTKELRFEQIADSIKDSDDIFELVLFTINSKQYKFEDILKGFENEPTFQTSLLAPTKLSQLVKLFTERELIKEEIKTLEKSDKEFQKIMVDYKNGLMIFKLQENVIWKDITVKEEDKIDYYNNNKDLFKWPERFAINLINHPEKKTIDSMVTVIKKHNKIDSDILKEFSNYKIKADTIMAANKSRIVSKAKKLKEGEFSDAFRSESMSWFVIQLVKKLPEMHKDYKDCSSELASKVMEMKNKMAETEYIQKLKEIYEPEYFYENLEKAFK